MSPLGRLGMSQHYGEPRGCRVPDTLGKDQIILGKWFTKSNLCKALTTEKFSAKGLFARSRTSGS
jgi:hypothetical protein